MIRNTELQFCLDTLVLETLLSSGEMIKTSEDIMSGLIGKIKNYVSSSIDPNNKVASILDLLAPGVLTVLGHPVIAFIVMLAENFFGFSIGNIFMGIVDKVKGLITGGKETNSQEVDAAVESVVKANLGAEPTEADLAKFKDKDPAIDAKSSLRDAQLVKLAFINHAGKAGVAGALAKLTGVQSKTGSILGSILKWVVKMVLAAGGFMILGDVATKLMGTTKADPTPSGFPTLTPTHKGFAVPAAPPSSQNLFKVNPNYNEEKLNINRGWIEAVPPSQIGSEIVDWTQEIYPELAHMTNFIKSSARFQKTVSDIQEANANNTSNITFMPSMFSSRKKVVDTFIDDLANKAKSLPNAPKSKEAMTAFNHILQRTN
jgi:hypothetical protein